jgi:ABC-type phosphate transport system auxiliary subunit
MTDVHLVVGVAVIALNLLAGSWGGVAWLRDQPSIAFWYMLRAAQVAVVIQVLLGGLLVFAGREADEGLHYLYGILPLPVSLLAETARAEAAQRELGDIEFEDLPAARQRSLALAIVRREMGIMAVSCLVILFLGLRAAGTSSAF